MSLYLSFWYRVIFFYKCNVGTSRGKDNGNQQTLQHQSSLKHEKIRKVLEGQDQKMNNVLLIGRCKFRNSHETSTSPAFLL